jgi:hypothetical protein
VDRTGWGSGNAMALIITGSGRRTAEAFDGTVDPVLHIKYQVGGPATNRPPVAAAGADQTVLLADGATVSGSMTDDGLPDPPATVTTTWSMTSGPGEVTFGDPGAVSTAATFSATGSYVLRLTASDSELTGQDELTVDVVDETTPVTVNIPVTASTDDAEEKPSGSMRLASSDLELVTEGTTVQKIGLRFAGVTVPAGATILGAYVQFTVDEVSTDVASLTVQGQAADNPPTFSTTSLDVSSRQRTLAAVGWTPPAWNTVGASGPDQRTADLSSVVQEIVDRTGWGSGNAMALIITGSGRRTAEAFDGTVDPVLHIEYQL